MMTLSIVLLGGINLQIGMRELVFPIVLTGISITLIFVPLSVTTLGDLRAEQTGAATGIFNLMRNLGGSFGISLLQTFVTRESQKTQDVLVGHFLQLNRAYEQYLATLKAHLATHDVWANAAHQAQQLAYNLLQQQAASLAYVNAFQLLTGISLVCVPLPSCSGTSRSKPEARLCPRRLSWPKPFDRKKNISTRACHGRQGPKRRPFSGRNFERPNFRSSVGR